MYNLYTIIYIRKANIIIIIIIIINNKSNGLQHISRTEVTLGLERRIAGSIAQTLGSCLETYTSTKVKIQHSTTLVRSYADVVVYN